MLFARTLARLDPRELLVVAGLYSRFSKWINPDRQKVLFVETVLRAREGERVLDIGCGPADLLPFLPRVDYIGFDANPGYIAEATARHGARGTFLCQNVGEQDVAALGTFDLVMAIGVLHHLNNAQATDLFGLARKALKPGGRLVTCDGVLIPGQNPVARILIKLDRGRHVRTLEGYRALAHRDFPDFEVEIRTDLNRIPYTHCIMTCPG